MSMFTAYSNTSGCLFFIILLRRPDLHIFLRHKILLSSESEVNMSDESRYYMLSESEYDSDDESPEIQVSNDKYLLKRSPSSDICPLR